MTQPEIEIRRAWRHAVGIAHDGYVDALLGRYREPHRAYHTATHIMMVVRDVHEISTTFSAEPSPELVAAVLYHDAIYDPRSSDNEARSASLAASVLADVGWSTERCEAVTALILATAAHVGAAASQRSGEPASEIAVLVDADLAILGAEPSRYQAYVNGVRSEYAFVDDDGWRTGRAAVLQRFLDADRLFCTEHMARLEHRARANLEAELATLQ